MGMILCCKEILAETQKLSKYEKRFEDDWYKDYEYDLNEIDKTITLKKYISDDEVAYVGKTARIRRKDYKTILQGDSTNNGVNTIFGGTVATRVKLQKGIEEIGDYTFFGNSNLKSIIIPNGVSVLPMSNFYGSFSNLETVYIPSSVDHMGEGVLCGCSKLKTLIIGAREITNSAFCGLSQLENVKLMEGVEIVTNGAFSLSGNNKVKSIIFPSSIRTIANSAFNNGTALENLVLPEGIVTIAYAFQGCTSLTNITIPDSVESISGNSFSVPEELRTNLYTNNEVAADYNWESVKRIITNKIEIPIVPLGSVTAGQRANLKSEYIDETNNSNNRAIIPRGFTVSNLPNEKIVDNGLVIYDIPKDKVSSIDWTNGVDGDGNNLQETYNQFVWVPVPNFSEFVRHDYGSKNILDEDFINTQPTSGKYYEPTADGVSNSTEVEKMYKSVKDNGGFYIARYEAGTTANGSQIRGNVVSKKGSTVYNYIRWSSQNDMTIEAGGVVEVSRGMYSGHSTLCYGVQWDAVMRWISNDSLLSGYLINSSGKGNYSDTSSTYGSPGNTGLFEMKNIYDMAGNVYEWTMEAYDTWYHRVARGGGYYGRDSQVPVTYRYDYIQTGSGHDIGFRVALYV